MSAQPLEFWFDFGSTYSYLAAQRIEEAAAARRIPIAWKPFLLGPLFRIQGWTDSPYNLNPLRGRYMWRDMERLCARYALPFHRPSRFPRNGLLAARIGCLVSGEAWCPAFCRAVFHANFAEDREIAEPEIIREILDRLGQDGTALIDRAQRPANKERLRRQTAAAEQLGLFGAPHFVVGREIFWGHDRLEDAFAWYLEDRRGGGTSGGP